MKADVDFSLASQIAEDLARQNTDHNELAKASSYLNAVRNAGDFFKWLALMANSGVSQRLARSNRTPAYYRSIEAACHGLRQIEDVETMAQTLAWAVRLMRYQERAAPLPVERSAALRTEQDVAAEPVTVEPSATPNTIQDLQPGMALEGRVTNVKPYGAFVDVGVGRDGLVHVSKLREGYVASPEDVVKPGQPVTVWVESVDVGRGRISLTMIPPKQAAPSPEPRWAARPQQSASATEKQPPQPVSAAPEPAPPPPQPALPARPAAVRVSSADEVKPGMWVKGTVQAIEHSRIVVDIGLPEAASLTFDRLPDRVVDQEDAEAVFEVGQEIEAQVARINRRGRVQLTLESL